MVVWAHAGLRLTQLPKRAQQITFTQLTPHCKPQLKTVQEREQKQKGKTRRIGRKDKMSRRADKKEEEHRMKKESWREGVKKTPQAQF